MQCPMKFFSKILEKRTSISQACQLAAFMGAQGRFLQFSLHGKGWARKKTATEVQYNAWEKIINSGPTGGLKINFFLLSTTIAYSNTIFLIPRQDRILNRTSFLLHSALLKAIN